MLVYCPTPVALILIPFADPMGVLRFPSDQPPTPGVILELKPLVPVIEQIFAKVASAFDLPSPAKQYSVCEEYTCEVTLADERAATLYVLRSLEPVSVASKEWGTFPDLLRAMPPTRTRLAYLKAWQVLTGGLEAQTKAVEAQEVLKELKDGEPVH